ncbi:PH domain-containing protein [Nocardia paucivorans]|uniref:PH domain-containing protein n=1 Tax=Nocardia paucivorans TaxID=114259 RepID=UPI001FE21BE3|nr:PH domain-containing protein [Nocardia paucivorans]
MTRVIRVPRLAFLGVFMLLLCVFFPIVGWPAGLWWLLLLPIGASVWLLRTRTTITPEGLHLRTVFGSRFVAWERVRGLRIPKRGFVRVHLDDDTEAKLPAVGYDRLRDLVAASGGRIPDPFAPPPTLATTADAEGPRPSRSRTDSPAADGDPAEGESAESGNADSDDTAAKNHTDTTPPGTPE